MIIKRHCRYKGIMCSLATEFGYCNLTACINRGVNHEAQVRLLDDVSTAYENGYLQGKFEAQQWIPCSERLPKVGAEILATIADDSYKNPVIIRHYEPELEEKILVAWMPLPEPYKGDES